jgi:hypothetical protein
MTRVRFLGRDVPCEKLFKISKTDIGECFTANSLYSNENFPNGRELSNFRQLPMRYSNRDDSDTSLEVHYIDNEFVVYKLYIHTPEELPDGNFDEVVLRKANAFTYVAYKTTEILNQDDVKYESINSRKCRFPDEYLNEYKLPYSISNCHFHERMQRELKSCGCTLPG